MEKHEVVLQYPVHERWSFKVPGSGIDTRKRMTIPALVQEMQEVALLSTRHLGVSVFDLEPHRLGWVLLGQRVLIHEPLLLAKPYEIITAPVGFERVFTFRDFHVIDQENGKVVATAATTWMLMNLDTRRMATLPDWIKKIDERTPDKSAQLERASYKLLKPDSARAVRDFRVGYHELDFNGHLTNPVYVRWMLEGLGKSILEGPQPKEIRVQYAKEARYGETITVGLNETDRAGHYQHGLFRNDELLASMQTRFD